MSAFAEDSRPNVVVILADDLGREDCGFMGGREIKTPHLDKLVRQGLAFTRANVGYVHAIAHQLGGKYHTPHGLANAIMLPHVLAFLSPAITKQLAVLAVHARVGKAGDRPAVLAKKFLASVETLNRDLGIPRYLDALRDEDIPALAKAACWEADTNYPVPRYMSPETCAELIRKVLPKPAPRRKR